jgi:hypothetical protein
MADAGAVPNPMLADFLGRVHGTLVEVGKQINTVLITQTVLSVVVLSLCCGVITADNEYAVAGLKVHVDAPFVLIAGAFAASALLLNQLGLVEHESVLLALVFDLYEAAGFPDARQHDAMAGPLEHPNIVTSVLNLPRTRNLRPTVAHGIDTLLRSITIVATIGLPLAAQAAVAWRLQETSINRFLLAAPVASIGLSIGYLFLFSRSRAKRGLTAARD